MLPNNTRDSNHRKKKRGSNNTNTNQNEITLHATGKDTKLLVKEYTELTSVNPQIIQIIMGELIDIIKVIFGYLNSMPLFQLMYLAYYQFFPVNDHPNAIFGENAGEIPTNMVAQTRLKTLINGHNIKNIKTTSIYRKNLVSAVEMTAQYILYLAFGPRTVQDISRLNTIHKIQLTNSLQAILPTKPLFQKLLFKLARKHAPIVKKHRFTDNTLSSILLEWNKSNKTMQSIQTEIEVQLNTFLNENENKINDIKSQTNTPMQYIKPSTKLLNEKFENFYTSEKYNIIKHDIIQFLNKNNYKMSNNTPSNHKITVVQTTPNSQTNKQDQIESKKDLRNPLHAPSAEMDTEQKFDQMRKQLDKHATLKTDDNLIINDQNDITLPHDDDIDQTPGDDHPVIVSTVRLPSETIDENIDKTDETDNITNIGTDTDIKDIDNTSNINNINLINNINNIEEKNNIDNIDSTRSNNINNDDKSDKSDIVDDNINDIIKRGIEKSLQHPFNSSKNINNSEINSEIENSELKSEFEHKTNETSPNTKSEVQNPILEQLIQDVKDYQSSFQYINKYTYAQCANFSTEKLQNEINHIQRAWWHRYNSLTLLHQLPEYQNDPHKYDSLANIILCQTLEIREHILLPLIYTYYKKYAQFQLDNKDTENMLHALNFDLKTINFKLLKNYRTEKPGVLVSSIQQFHFALKFLVDNENKFIPVDSTNTGNLNSSFPWSTPQIVSERKIRQNLGQNSEFGDDPNDGFLFPSVTPSTKSTDKNKNNIQTKSILKTKKQNISTNSDTTSFSNISFNIDELSSSGLSNDDNLFNSKSLSNKSKHVKPTKKLIKLSPPVIKLMKFTPMTVEMTRTIVTVVTNETKVIKIINITSFIRNIKKY